VIYSFKLINLM